MSAAPVLAPVPKSSMRLLIVDDSVQDAVLMAAALEREGHAAIFDQVDSPESLRSRLANGDYDAILCDHNLRTWTAKDALEIVRSMSKNIPFVVVTGTLGDERAVQYLKDGASDYVLKESLDRLPSAIERALREKTQREENTRLQAAIWIAKKDWERTFDAIPDSIMLLNHERRITRANRATAELLGVPFSQIVDQRCFELVHCTSEPPANCPFTRTQTTNGKEVGEFVEPRLHKTVRATTIPFRNGSGECGAIHVMQDLTESKRLEEALIQAHKLEAVGRLAGGVAHDFNNLLSVILGYSELLHHRLSQDEISVKQTQSIIEAVQQAAKLTSQLLAFSRKQVMQPTVLDLNRLVTGLSEMLHRLIGENIELVVTPEANPSLVKADPVQLEQVLMNLVVNARDALPKGGAIAISTNNLTVESEPDPRLPEQVPDGHYVTVSVSDTGAGMPPETVRHIFEPFFTTKDKSKGTGLGLAIVYGIVKQSGGCISVDSEMGRGSTFTIFLPETAEQSENVQALAASVVADTDHTETILLVEDELRISAVVSTVLESAGYTVLRATTAKEAVECAKAYRGKIDLMLTDIVLRGQMDGTELAQAIKAVRPATKMLFMSGYSDSLLGQGGEYNHIPLLRKPFTVAELRSKVREQLSGAAEPAGTAASLHSSAGSGAS